jgi:hypothetical protein
MERRLYSVKEAGAVIGHGKTKTHQLINRGLLEAVLVDGVLRVTDEGIDRFLRNLEPANRREVPERDGRQGDRGAQKAATFVSPEDAQERKARRK